jgi:hypothetical protein
MFLNMIVPCQRATSRTATNDTSNWVDITGGSLIARDLRRRAGKRRAILRHDLQALTSSKSIGRDGGYGERRLLLLRCSRFKVLALEKFADLRKPSSHLHGHALRGRSKKLSSFRDSGGGAMRPMMS